MTQTTIAPGTSVTLTAGDTGSFYDNGGTLDNFGTISSATVTSGGTINDSGDSTNITVGYRGILNVEGGSHDYGAHVSGDYASMTIAADGFASHAYVANTDDISVSGTLTNALDVSGDIDVENGGTMIGTTFSVTANYSGVGIVFSGGEASSTTILQGGDLSIRSSGKSFDTIVKSGGLETLGGENSTSYNATIQSGGSQIGYFYATIKNSQNWGTISLNATDVGNSITDNSGGVISFSEGSTITNNLYMNGGIASLQQGVILSSGSKIVFEGKNVGTLDIIGEGGNFTIKKFGKNDVINLSGTSIKSSMITTLGASGTLIVGSIHFDFIKGAGEVLDLASTSSGVDISRVNNVEAFSDEMTIGRNDADKILLATSRQNLLSISEADVMATDTIYLGNTVQYNQNITVGSGTEVTGGTFGQNSNLTVEQGGTSANNLFIGPDVHLYLDQGAFSFNDTIDGNVLYDVYGTASNPTVKEGIFAVENGGTVIGAHFEVFGGDVVYAGGTDIGAIDAGSQIINLGGTANQAQVIKGQFVDGTANYTTIYSNAIQWDSGIATHDLINQGGVVSVTANAIIETPTINGGTLELEAGSTIEGAISFAISGGNLTDAKSGDLKIKTFNKGDMIDLSGTSIISSMTTTLGASGTLIVGSIHLDFIKGAGEVLNLASTSSGVDISFIKKVKVPPEDVTIGRNHADALSIGPTDHVFALNTEQFGYVPAPLSSHGILSSTITGIVGPAHTGFGDVAKTILTPRADSTSLNFHGFDNVSLT